MTTKIPAKRRRGAQPGNHNSRNNRGNKTPNRHRFAKDNSLGGAPLHNQNALKKRPAHVTLLAQFSQDAEAARWIREHAAEIDALKDDNERDVGIFAGFQGLTPDVLAAKGLEYKLRMYTTIDLEVFDDDDVAA